MSRSAAVTKNLNGRFAAYWVSDYSGEISGPKITKDDVESLKQQRNASRKKKK